MKAAALGRMVPLLATFWAALSAPVAHAGYTCTVSSSPISTVYSPTVATDNISTSTNTVTCTRLMTDPATFSYTLRADNGLQPTGATNRVQRGATTNRYQYELYRITPYINGNRWQNTAATQLSGTINFGASLTASDTTTFDLRVPGSQAVVTAGTYTDTVSTFLRNAAGGGVIYTGSLSVTVITTNSCEIETSPGPLNFTYTSFQGGVASANTSFGVRCTTSLFYSMSLDATSASLLGLNYTLALSAASSTGTGTVQSFNVTGSIAAGQAGTCGALGSCSGSQTRTLTITY